MFFKKINLKINDNLNLQNPKKKVVTKKKVKETEIEINEKRICCLNRQK